VALDAVPNLFSGGRSLWYTADAGPCGTLACSVLFGPKGSFLVGYFSVKQAAEREMPKRVRQWLQSRVSKLPRDAIAQHRGGVASNEHGRHFEKVHAPTLADRYNCIGI